MLDVMRSNAKSSLVVVVFGVIIASFIISFGRGSSGFKGNIVGETWAAKVNGEYVTATDFKQAFQGAFREQAARRGGKYTLEQARQDKLGDEALKGLVDQELIAQQAEELGIVVSDKELADQLVKDPQFQQDGKFDDELYKARVENGYQMSVHRFEEDARRRMLRSRVLEAMLASATVADDEVKAKFLTQNEQAAIAYVKFTAFMFRDKALATEAEGAEFAKTHAAEIQAAYDKDQKTRWTQAAGVKVRAITVSLPPGSTPEQEKAAQARIDAAEADVKSGKDFATVAKEKSEDSTTKDKGGDLGFVSKGASAYGKTLEDEALKLSVGAVSPVFKDRTGFHILKAEETRAEAVKPLADVQAQIATDLVKAQKAKDLAHARAVETLTDLRAGKDLKDLFPAKKTEPGQFDFSSFTTPQSAETEKFSPQGGYLPGIGQAPKLSAAVFAMTDAGALPAAPVEDGDTWYVFKLKERVRADPSKLDDAAKKRIRDELEQRKQMDLYTSMLERLRKSSKIVENEKLLASESLGQANYANPDDN